MALDVQNSLESGQQHWLRGYHLQPITVVVVSLFWLIVFMGLSFFDVDTAIDSMIADPINFKMRDIIHKTPVQDSRLKIFAIDDRTFAKLGTPMPNMDFWSEIFDAIAAKEPKIIVVDAMFSALPEPISDHAEKLLMRARASHIKIATGSFIAQGSLPFKTPMILDGDQYALDHYLDHSIERYTNEKIEGSGGQSIAPTLGPTWPNRKDWSVYGPHENLQNVFSWVGHIQLFHENKIDPFIWLGGQRVLPHLALYAADSVAIKDKSLLIDGIRVALDRQGGMPVNFLPLDHFRVQSLLPVYDDAKAGYRAEGVSPGDVVLILPGYFTGNVDLRPSPYGWMPGGIYVASVLNSILTKQWLQPILASEVLIFILILIASVAAFCLPAIGFWIAWSCVIGVVFASSQAVFAFEGLVIPYLMPIVAGTITGAQIFAMKVRSNERKSMALRLALDGAISPRQLENLSRRPEQINLEPRERIVTLMFIDVVGFSISSENMLPRLAFDNLKSILNKISDMVHQHGGVVDKTLGDGLLCYFGYYFDTDETDSEHPEKAVKCALSIQDSILDDSVVAAKAGRPLYPLRIGINTASCYLGNLGSGQRIEFTVVGNGVNYAKRLEAACDMYNIMIGSTTYDLVKGIDFGTELFCRKMIKIKHHDELMDAYEVRPLEYRQEEREFAIETFRRVTSLQRLNERLRVKDQSAIRCQTSQGPGYVKDFSGSGASVVFETAVTLARGSLVEVALESRDGGLHAALASVGLGALAGEVRWSYPSEQGVVHGILFKTMTAKDQQEFLRILTAFAFVEPASRSDAAAYDLEKIKVG